MENPLISVVVPTFNARRFLPEALASILAQTYRPIEVIVADDGSTDGTVELARQWDPPVRVVAQPTAGPAATRNLGAAHAAGPFLAFLDPDDLWMPDKLALQAARFAQRPELDLCVTHVQPFWEEEVRADGLRYADHPRAQPVPGFATTTLLARRSAMDRLGPFDPGLWFSDAVEWFIRAREAGLVIELMDEVLVRHRMHTSNLTRRRPAGSIDEFARVLKASLDRRRAADAPDPAPPAGAP
ncbi:MAG: hypothetical protein BIFFINMI_04075 [Phycisphaerae bacterium]|nr:hypothetical protein [Phycisphaerae bacterium]